MGWIQKEEELPEKCHTCHWKPHNSAQRKETAICGFNECVKEKGFKSPTEKPNYNCAIKWVDKEEN